MTSHASSCPPASVTAWLSSHRFLRVCGRRAGRCLVRKRVANPWRPSNGDLLDHEVEVCGEVPIFIIFIGFFACVWEEDWFRLRVVCAWTYLEECAGTGVSMVRTLKKKKLQNFLGGDRAVAAGWGHIDIRDVERTRKVSESRAPALAE